MAKKIKELVVKTGSYTDRNGNEKAQWLNIGAIFKGENGSFMLLNRHFNPAGIATKEGKPSDSIMVSLFDPKEKEGSEGQSAPPAKASSAKSAPAKDDFDEDVPF